MILELKDIKGGYTKNVDILRGVSLSVEKGEALGIIGLNGSGKSTLGKSILNMLPHQSGTIILNGENISGLSTSEIASKGISIMHQGGKVFDNLTVDENLSLAGKASAEFKKLIPLLQEGIGSRMADRLSGGQRHQLALAMALLGSPQLVVLDEPSAGLSPKAVDEMYLILSTVRKELGISIILIEQNISKAITFCDRSLLIAQGQIEQEFKSQDITEIEKIMFNKKDTEL
ncbi:MAG: ATP-binding cassette domain-containing protein [Prevotella sp.]|nr:ATP-binding cassette domain-containing protein [Prevotella sp.]